MLEIDKPRVGQLTFQGEVLHLMKNVIEKEKLPFNVMQEEIDKKGKRVDLVVKVLEDSREKKYCFIEIEDPKINPYDSSLVEAAGYKAFKHGVEYFVTWTVNELVLWKAFEKGTSLMERRQTYFDTHSVGLQAPTYAAALQKRKELSDFLYKFLKHLYAIYVGAEKVEKPGPDDVFVRLLRSMITPISMHTSHHIWRMCQEDPDFKKKLQSWFENEQMWSPASAKDVERAARQFAYMLVDKMFFYTILRPTHKLPDLFIPENVSGDRAREILQERFERVLKIDYENIFLTDFVDELPIPDEAVPLLSRFTSELEKYDFSDMSYEIMGNIFQGLIPAEERHVLGQYFTRSDVVDLISGFCVKDENSTVLDPACGAGTFLVRSYSRIKNFELGRDHGKMLAQLYGVEISKFPAHLSTMNLAARNIRARLNYPAIIHNDFFETAPSTRYEIRGFGGRKVGGKLPEAFDAVITNPPYTRQEEMEKQGFPKGYREKLKKLIEKDWNFSIGKRSSIYSHFFFHGGKFLKEGGRLGLITSNSWLDVDYGKYLQEFFLRNFKIIAIIESKLERWFEDADINTAITILERCSEEDTRNKNMVKFVQLKRPLMELIPSTEDEWERWNAVDELVASIETSGFLEEDKIRIFAKQQLELWNEGFRNKKYQGGKWGKYIRASNVLKILDKIKSKLVPLSSTSEIKPGCYSGINDFFYLNETKASGWKIEKEFLIPLIRTSRQVETVKIDSPHIDTMVFACDLSKDELEKRGKLGGLKYVEWGSQQVTRKRQKVEAGVPWPKVETVKKRKPGWWSIPPSNLKPTNLFMLYVINDRFVCPYSDEPIVPDRCFHRIFPKELVDYKLLCATLNCSLTYLMIQMTGRETLGQGALKFETTDAKKLLIIDPTRLKQKEELLKSLEDISSRPIGTIFEEIGANIPEEVSFDKIKSDRRELDKIIMGEILGLTTEEQLEVYRAVIDLVKSRLDRAKSV